MKPQRVYQGMNSAFGDGHVLRHDDRPVADRRRAVPARLQAAPLDQLRPGGPARLDRCRRRSACAAADPTRHIVALSGDYDFQFMIEELAVGAQFQLPYIHVVVNNSYLGLIRQAQRGFDMDYCVSALVRQRQRAGAGNGYGVDHVEGRRGPGLQGDPRVPSRRRSTRRSSRPRSGWPQYRVPVVVEIMLERVTNIAMGTEIDNVDRVRGAGGEPAGRADGDRGAPRLTTRRRHAEVLRQPHDALQRGRLPRPVRGRREVGLQGCGIPLPLCLPRGAVARAAGQAPARAGAAQPAGRRLGEGRARDRLPSGPRRRVPGRRRQGDRVRDRARLQAGELPRRHRAAGRRGREAARDLCRQPPLRRAEARRRGDQAPDRADQHPRHSRLLSDPHEAGRSS